LDLEVAGFSLSILPTSGLRPHEETIRKHVKTVVEELRKDLVQKDPLLIDVNTRTVLDGMHRLAAFAKLGLTNAVCCSFEYGKDAVVVGRWARVYEAESSKALKQVVEDVGLVKGVPPPEALSALEEGQAGLAAIIGENARVTDRKMALAEAFSIVRRVDKAAEELGWNRKFVREDEIIVGGEPKNKLVILVRKISKGDVLSAAGTGRLFPCKTSMHAVDPRPVAVNFPTGELNRATTEKLRERLTSAKPKILPADSVYGGRRYKERLLLLNPE